MNERTEFINGLRAMADWYEANPQITVPTFPEMYNFAMDTKDECAATIRALGSCKKDYGDTLFTVSGKFGTINAQFVFNRSSVCVKRVIGKRDVPETLLPAIPAQPERVVPAHIEEITEWDCGPILVSNELVAHIDRVTAELRADNDKEAK